MTMETTALLAPIVNFTAVAIVLVKVGRKPFKAYFADRSKAVGEAMTLASKEAAIAEAAVAEVRKKTATQQQDADDAMVAAKKSLEQVRLRALENAEQEGKRVRSDGIRLADSEKASVRRALSEDLVRKSLQLSAQYFEREVELKEKRGLLGAFLESVGNGKH